MSQTPLDQLRTTAEVCDQFGCNKSTLSRWVKDGLISPAYKLPGDTGAFLFTPKEVARFKPIALERLARRGNTQAVAS